MNVGGFWRRGWQRPKDNSESGEVRRGQLQKMDHGWYCNMYRQQPAKAKLVGSALEMLIDVDRARVRPATAACVFRTV